MDSIEDILAGIAEEEANKEKAAKLAKAEAEKAKKLEEANRKKVEAERKNALAEIEKCLKDADAALEAATNLAEKHGVDFRWLSPSYQSLSYVIEPVENYCGDKLQGWTSSSDYC